MGQPRINTEDPDVSMSDADDLSGSSEVDEHTETASKMATNMWPRNSIQAPSNHVNHFPMTPISAHHSYLYSQSPHQYTPPTASSYVDSRFLLPQMMPLATPMVSYADTNEVAFSRGLFEGLFGDESSTSKRRSRAVFQWPESATLADRLTVLVRCMQQAGFEGIGDALAALFSGEKFSDDRSLTGSLTAFFKPKSDNQKAHISPVKIIDLIFHHPLGIEFHNRIPVRPTFNLRRYALPPSQRINPGFVLAYKHNSAQNAILDWALARILAHVDYEADLLIKPEIGFAWPPSLKKKLDWRTVLEWSMSQSQEKIATMAPVIFAVLTTIAVNKDLRSGVEPDDDTSGVGDGLLSEESEENGRKMRRDPWLGSTVAILCLLYFRYRFALLFPTLIGVFLFTCNANRDIFAILGRLGLSIAYSTVLASLQNLAADSDQYLRAIGALTKTKEPTFLFLFDNVNKMKRAWQQNLGKEDEVKNGTAATIIQLEDMPPGALDAKPYLENVKRQERKGLTVEKLLDDIDWPHIEAVGAGTILRVWLKWVPALSRFQIDVDNLFTTTHAKHRLRLRKSVVHPMRTTDIDESSTSGAASVLRNLMAQLGIAAEWWPNWLIPVCGDQLTIDRIRKIKCYTRKADSSFHAFDWALPVIQLWHLKWNWQKCIVRLHWWDGVGKNVFGLHHDCDLLGRRKFNPQKCDFYPTHHILEDRFDALLLEGLRIICEQRSRQSSPPTMKLLDDVRSHFARDGSLGKISFQDLSDMATTVYNRYLCNAAHEAAIGHGNPIAYGLPTQNTETVAEAGATATSKTATTKQTAKKAAAADMRNFAHGDQSLATTINFMRTTFWYLEMCAATAEGDIGRVFEIMKLLRFSFWGAGSTNYGNELLELACNFFYEFPEELKTAILNNYLVNPSGTKGHWFELDLLQEHFNFWIKRLFNSKSHEFDSRHLSEAVSLNISGFSALRDRFPSLFGAKKSKHNHTSAKKDDDINKLGFHYRHDGVLYFIRDRDHAYVVQDEFASGFSKLKGGQLKSFLDRTTNGSGFFGEESPEDEASADSESDRTPANPITTDNGIMGISEFVGDNTQYDV